MTDSTQPDSTQPDSTQPDSIPTDTSGTLAQLQSRLLSLTGQMDAMQQQLQQLIASAQENTEHVSSLTRNLTDPSAAQALHTQLAELTTQMAEGRELLTGVAGSVAQLAAANADAGAQEMREHFDTLTHTVAKQDQMERLIQMVASEERVSGLADEVQMLIRTQLKANALLESKDAQVNDALRTLQEIATRREALHTEQSAESLQRLSEVRQTARAELAADLLPAIDALEDAMESGQGMVAQLRARSEERRAQRRRHQAARQQQAAAQAAAPRRTGLFSRLQRPPEAAETPSAPPPPEDGADRLDTQNIQTVEQWLGSLQLIHHRFFSLLAAESIEVIPAQDQPFDPHLHAAVETEAADGVPPGTVLRVLRKGYRQKGRVLRYAEVVVTRPLSSAGPAPADSPSDSPADEGSDAPPTGEDAANASDEANAPSDA